MSLLLEAARTLMAGSSLSYCQLSLGGPLVLVVLSCVCSSMYHCVGLLGFRACLDGCTAVSLCMCVVSLACSYLVVSPCLVRYQDVAHSTQTLHSATNATFTNSAIIFTIQISIYIYGPTIQNMNKTTPKQ